MPTTAELGCYVNGVWYGPRHATLPVGFDINTGLAGITLYGTTYQTDLGGDLGVGPSPVKLSLGESFSIGGAALFQFGDELQEITFSVHLKTTTFDRMSLAHQSLAQAMRPPKGVSYEAWALTAPTAAGQVRGGWLKLNPNTATALSKWPRYYQFLPSTPPPLFDGSERSTYGVYTLKDIVRQVRLLAQPGSVGDQVTI